MACLVIQGVGHLDLGLAACSPRRIAHGCCGHQPAGALIQLAQRQCHRPQFSFASQGRWPVQITQGAPVDVILSASPVTFDWLETADCCSRAAARVC